MNTKQLEYFLELAQVLNYRRASERLGITQPTLSKAMEHLENDLGFPLFARSGRSISLTPQGKTFVPYAQEGLNRIEQGIRAAMQRETLRLGCIIAIANSVLPEFVRLYQKRNPGALVQIHSAVSNDLQDMLENDKLDIVLCSPSERYSDISFFPLFEQPLVVCMHPSHPLAGRTVLYPEDLLQQTFVIHTRNGYFYRLYASIFHDFNCPLKIAAEADEDSALLSLVRNNMGICIVALNPTLNTTGLCIVPLRQDKVHRIVALGCKRSRAVELDAAALAQKLREFSAMNDACPILHAPL